MIQVKDKHFEPFITKRRLKQKIREIAKKLNEDFEGKNPIFIGVLNGSFMFFGDLMKHICIPCEMTFIRVASYEGTESSGKIKKIVGLNEDIANRHVVIIEDIVDTGLTMIDIQKQILEQHPAHLALTTLLFKPDALKVDIKLDYIGFSIKNRFVVGYGLDYDGYGRNLDEIYVLKNP